MPGSAEGTLVVPHWYYRGKAVDNLTLTFISRRAAREIYGYEPRDLLGRPIDVLLPKDVEQPAVLNAFNALREGKPIRDLEAVHLTQDGRRVIVSISAVPMRHRDGRFAGLIGMNADLTALKSRERRLSEALRVERTVLDSAGQAIAVVKQGMVQRCNDAFLRLDSRCDEDGRQCYGRCADEMSLHFFSCSSLGSGEPPLPFPLFFKRLERNWTGDKRNSSQSRMLYRVHPIIGNRRPRGL